jgi:hypothetical protein
MDLFGPKLPFPAENHLQSVKAWAVTTRQPSSYTGMAMAWFPGSKVGMLDF